MPKPRKPRKSLTKAELKIISELLYLAAQSFEDYDDGEEPFIIPASEENKEVMVKFLEETKNEDEIENVLEAKDELESIEWQLMRYFANKCKRLSNK